MAEKLKSMRENSQQVLGALGVLVCLAIFVNEPSFLTPDKLLIFLIFVFMAIGQATAMLRHLLPFVAIILIYESFRGIVQTLNNHVNYNLPASFDKAIFGNLPTATLQKWWWHGYVRWYDYLFYIPYMLFFVIPFAMAILVWKKREADYWHLIVAYSLTFYAGFVTFLLFPAAPPWLASQHGDIQPITRISSYVWHSLGIHDFPSVYNHISANPVAAVPSLHAACATLFSLFVFKLFGRRWGIASLIYPALIYIGVVYQGEHFVFDVLLGIVYAVAAYLATPYVTKKSKILFRNLSSKSKTLQHRIIK